MCENQYLMVHMGSMGSGLNGAYLYMKINTDKESEYISYSKKDQKPEKD